MPDISFTPQQQQAIRATGGSVLVSAAAGTGKTAVLAERCAHLIGDAPEADSCGADQLLVLTFTDAAAAEMRSRIVEAIRGRAAGQPGNQWLHEQAALIETAQISTLHAFCYWLVRRWFHRAGVDPAATLLDAEEAKLLRADVLEDLFQGLYAAGRAAGDPLGRVDEELADVEASHEPSGLAAGFARLVHDYGLGDDAPIGKFVLALHEFTGSLPDPQDWLRTAGKILGEEPEAVVANWVDEMRTVLSGLHEHVERLQAGIPDRMECVPDLARLRTFADQLMAWNKAIDPGATATVTHPVNRAVPASFEAMRQNILAYKFPRAAPRKKTDVLTAEQELHREFVRQQIDRLKEVFRERVQSRFGPFSLEELRQGLARIAPYVQTIVEVVRVFAERHAAQKRELNVLDFADLERAAFGLLCEAGNIDRPSDIAGSLHQRFAHVLVDEFQDINPLQLAILRLVSRESHPELRDNLFAVGDVKQSIYRFRLAEPSLFVDRLEHFRSRPEAGLALALSTNFRSCPEILEAVNTLFRVLWRPEGGAIAYGPDAELRPGRSESPCRTRHPVEVHLLEGRPSGESGGSNGAPGEESEPAAGADTEPGADYASDARHWNPIEREAYVIGSRIRELMRPGETVIGERPLRMGDIAILLRAARTNAEQVAAVLGRMGIAARAEAGTSLLKAREVRDVLAALELLDNTQQDVPLAAVLRSGIGGGRLSADDLARIRLFDRAAPFHATVSGYAAHGSDAELRGRLADVLGRLERYRHIARRRPVAELLWLLYEQAGYLAYAGGLPNGAQRRANLLRLHDLARKFGTFRRQGLRRFLRFLGSLEDEDMGLAAAPSGEHADDVVRILTIHQAKGLEFSVVFMAGLGTPLNLDDAKGRMIYARRNRIGLRAVDPARMIEYPSAAHHLVVREIERTTREEELRVLYVALTRARERLVLVGSDHRTAAVADAMRRRSIWGEATKWNVSMARTPVDWLIPALDSASQGTVRWPGDITPTNHLFEVHVHAATEMGAWGSASGREPVDDGVRGAASQLAPLQPGTPTSATDAIVAEVRMRIESTYPNLASSSVSAVQAASAFRGRFDFREDAEERAASAGGISGDAAASWAAARGPSDAARRGIVNHRVLQHLDFARVHDHASLTTDLARLIGDGLLTNEESALVDLEGMFWFLDTPLARAIRDAGPRFRRELAFVSREPLSLLDAAVRFDPEDYVLVRGIVDGVLPTTEGIELVDYKTDAVTASGAAEHALRYRRQMELYARAAARAFRKQVTTVWLVFLGGRELVSWQDLGGSGGAARPAGVASMQEE